MREKRIKKNYSGGAEGAKINRNRARSSTAEPTRGRWTHALSVWVCRHGTEETGRTHTHTHPRDALYTNHRRSAPSSFRAAPGFPYSHMTFDGIIDDAACRGVAALTLVSCCSLPSLSSSPPALRRVRARESHSACAHSARRSYPTLSRPPEAVATSLSASSVLVGVRLGRLGEHLLESAQLLEDVGIRLLEGRELRALRLEDRLDVVALALRTAAAAVCCGRAALVCIPLLTLALAVDARLGAPPAAPVRELRDALHGRRHHREPLQTPNTRTHTCTGEHG